MFFSEQTSKPTTIKKEEALLSVQAFPELPNNRILLLATSFIAFFAGPRIFLGSNSLGEFARTSRTVAVNAKRKSVSMQQKQLLSVENSKRKAYMCTSRTMMRELYDLPF